MTQSLTIAKGYIARVPVKFTDAYGRTHAPLTGGDIQVDDKSVAMVRRHDDQIIEIEGLQVGQTAVRFRLGEDEIAIMAELMLSVTAARQDGEPADDGPTRVEFALDQVRFQGNPRAEDPERAAERHRQRERRQHAEREREDIDQNAAEQDEVRAAQQGKTPEQLALESQGPRNELKPSGPELANRLAAEGAGRSASVAAGATADRPQNNPDDPARPHNPGNQGGGGDTTGHMLSRPGDPQSASEKRRQSAADKREDEDEDESGRVADDDKSKSSQQRGGASSPGTTTSAPGSKRG